MPELPEVETTRRGIAPYLVGRRVTGVILRRPDLRWPIPPEISDLLPGQRIDAVERRAKYLLLHTAAGSALLHLGMSGVLRVLLPDAPVGRHDHVDIALERAGTQAPRILRFTDPRRFGCLLWQPPGETHELRYFKASDRKRAEALAELFATVGLQLTAKDLSTSWSGARDSRPNTFEIWFGNPALPPNCLQPQK